MNTYKRHRFPPDIISYAVWLYFRFNLSHRDIEEARTELFWRRTTPHSPRLEADIATLRALYAATEGGA